MLRLILLASLLAAAAVAQPREEAVIRRVLADQTAAWNRGDLETFMQGYENSPETAFVGAAGVRKGYQAVLERYRRDYPDPERMGETSFHDVEVRLLTPDCATVIGRFALERPASAGGPLAGIFSLVFHKTAAGWKIVLDHTSRSDTPAATAP